MTTRLRREGDITNHMAAELPRRPEDNAPVAAAPVGAISMVPLDAADVEVGATWRGAQRRRAQLKKSGGPQRRHTPLGGLPRAAWTPRERRLGRVDRAARRAADDALPTARASSSVVVGVQVFCSIMRLSRVRERPKLLIGGGIEWNADDLAFATCRLPGVLTSTDVLAREYRFWLSLPEVMFVIACVPCRIAATPGRQLGVNNPNAYVTTDATADVADHFNSPFVIGENHANIALLHGGEVLRKMDSRHERSARVRSPLVDGAPLGTEMVLDTGLPEVRHRIALAYEETRMAHVIGPAQHLHIKCSQTQRIASILDDPADVPAFLFVPGRLRFRSVILPCSRERPTVAAVLTFGEEGGGSHIRQTAFPQLRNIFRGVRNPNPGVRTARLLF